MDDAVAQLLLRALGPAALLATPNQKEQLMRGQMGDAQRIENLFRSQYPELPADAQAPGYFGRNIPVRMS